MLAAVERDDAPKIIAPFLTMTKTEVFKLGAAMGVPYDLTWSCLRAGAFHCGQCTACQRAAPRLCRSRIGRSDAV